MNNCVIKPKVRNTNGEFVDSRLFDSLLHYTSNRETAKQFYAVGTDSKFLDEVGSKAKFDENGEITFKSLVDLANINLEEENVKTTLNKDINSGTYNYNEAIPRLQSFNRSNPLSDKYMATIVNRADGKVDLVVVKRNSANENQLADNIANRTLQERIKFFLNKAGADYTFMEEDEKINGKYSTINAKQSADSLYQLIQVSEGKNIDSALSEEAGHFAIGALGKSPLVTRLQNLLTPSVQQEIMGEEYEAVSSRENPAREVAGYLVGKALEGNIDKRSGTENLVKRLVNQIRRVFYNITGNEVANAKIDAIKNAEEIARGFMSQHFQGTVETALETQETLYSAPDSLNVNLFKKVVKELKRQTTNMRSINNDAYKKYQGIEVKVETGRIFDRPSFLSDFIAVEGMLDAIDLLSDAIPEMYERINSIDFNTEDINPQNSRKIREVINYLQSSQIILDIINSAVNGGDTYRLQNVSEVTLDKLKELHTSFGHSLKNLTARTDLVSREYYTKFLEGIYGKTNITRADRVMVKGLKVYKQEGETIEIRELVEATSTGLNYFERYFASMSNNPDIIGQLHDKAAKEAQKLKNDRLVQFQDKIRILQKEIEELGIKDTDIFAEVSAKTGKLTGNFVTDYLWGDYENDWEEFDNEAKKEFYETNTNLKGKSSHERNILLYEHLRPLRKAWHREHSTWDEIMGRYVPNEKYKSEYYEKNIKGTNKEIALIKLLELKGEMDALIDGNGVPHRMPQFKGTTTNKIKNRKLFENTGKAFKNTLSSNLMDTFFEDSDDTEFGGVWTANTKLDNHLQTEQEQKNERIKRIPLFGINKLSDMSNLSTDLYQSLLAYAGMASNFKEMSNIVDVLEIGSNVLLKRETQKGILESNSPERSFAYSRIGSFLDQHVYGINSKKVKLGKLVINKVTGFMTKVGAVRFLGGNLSGGTANLLMGLTELTKEAIAGEHFSMADLRKATSLYFKDLPSNWLHAGDYVKQDKLSLFIRHMNATNENEKMERDYFTRKVKNQASRWGVKLNPFGENLFFPYKSGEHYMQSMAAIAMANKFKVFDKNGKEKSLWDAYIVTNIDESRPELGKTMQLEEGTQYVDRDTGELRDWDSRAETEFQDKAREVNNRMHGIYNKQDKIAFQNNFVGSMFTAMKGYALGMIQRRFGRNMYSTSLGGESEGSLVTFAKVALSVHTSFELSMRAIFLPTSTKTKQMMLDAGYSANQYHNMRRNFMDMVMIAATWILKELMFLGDDDDDRKRRLKGLDNDDEMEVLRGALYLYASRVHSEQSAFNTPWGMEIEASALFNPFPVGVSAMKDMWDIAKLGISQERHKTSSDRYKKGDLKVQYRIEQAIPYYKSYLTMKNPYRSAQSYQYGRVTGGAK